MIHINTSTQIKYTHTLIFTCNYKINYLEKKSNMKLSIRRLMERKKGPVIEKQKQRWGEGVGGEYRELHIVG